ncbi:MAG: tetratricopeptide repeat protein [Saprospiraceae bacterium]
MKQKKQIAKSINTPVLSPTIGRSWFKWSSWMIFALGVFAYLNTLTHDFTQDDAIVIYDNMYTTKGISGLKGLFTKDTFFGFFKEEGKAKLVSGGRYRPLTPAMFAIEYQMVGNNPWLGHLVNILLYGLLCMLVYKMLLTLLCHQSKDQRMQYLVFATAVLYSLHPLHTEVVANIKGRDEIMSMLGSVAALYAMLKYVDVKDIKYLWLACISFFVAFLSKENTITFLAVTPLALYYFRDLKWTTAVTKSAALLIPTVLILMIRFGILGNDFGGTPMELMNNPYLKLVNGNYIMFDKGEKLATILFTLGKYIQLLIFPHPLTNDYYPRHIDIKQMSDIGVILSMLVYVTLGYLAFAGLKNKSVVGFAASYFLITLSIVSNIVFPIGTNMSERFMFMPSLGFALLVGYLLVKWVYDTAGLKVFLIVLAVISGLYAVKTVTRNLVWESDFRLFTTDVKISTNSAKALNSAGGALTTEALKEEDIETKNQMLHQAITYLDKALVVHPTYKNAYLLKGNAHYYLKDYPNSISAYEQALAIDGEFKDAFVNLAVTLRDAGRQAGEVENNLAKAEQLLLRSYQMTPTDAETMRLLGVVNGIRGNHAEAIKYFEKVTIADPKNAYVHLELSKAYDNIGDTQKAQQYKNKAIEIDPDILKKASGQ